MRQCLDPETISSDDMRSHFVESLDRSCLKAELNWRITLYSNAFTCIYVSRRPSAWLTHAIRGRAFRLMLQPCCCITFSSRSVTSPRKSNSAVKVSRNPDCCVGCALLTLIYSAYDCSQLLGHVPVLPPARQFFAGRVVDVTLAY